MPSTPIEGFGLFVMLSLAVYRVRRLIAKDDISAPIRIRLPDPIRKWLECDWCGASWISIGAVYATHRWLIRLGPHWLLWAVAVACVVGLVGERLDP